MAFCMSSIFQDFFPENCFSESLKGRGGLIDKVSALKPQDHGFESHMGHDHDSSYDTGTGWFQEADSRVINCENLLHN